jgi:hypothetical protein
MGTAGGGGGGGVVVAPAALAAVASARLVLPRLVIRANPAGAQLVRLPTWLWVDPAGWAPRSATAAVPGVAVTATATPSRVVWSMGDGATVACASAGTPFRAGTDPAAASPDCGHTYRSSSQERPGGVFPVRATVFWTVTWSGAGQSGHFDDLSTTMTTLFRVLDSPAVTTG